MTTPPSIRRRGRVDSGGMLATDDVDEPAVVLGRLAAVVATELLAGAVDVGAIDPGTVVAGRVEAVAGRVEAVDRVVTGAVGGGATPTPEGVEPGGRWVSPVEMLTASTPGSTGSAGCASSETPARSRPTDAAPSTPVVDPRASGTRFEAPSVRPCAGPVSAVTMADRETVADRETMADRGSTPGPTLAANDTAPTSVAVTTRPTRAGLI